MMHHRVRAGCTNPHNPALLRLPCCSRPTPNPPARHDLEQDRAPWVCAITFQRESAARRKEVLDGTGYAFPRLYRVTRGLRPGMPRSQGAAQATGSAGQLPLVYGWGLIKDRVAVVHGLSTAALGRWPRGPHRRLPIVRASPRYRPRIPPHRCVAAFRRVRGARVPAWLPAVVRVVDVDAAWAWNLWLTVVRVAGARSGVWVTEAHPECWLTEHPVVTVRVVAHFHSHAPLFPIARPCGVLPYQTPN